jgi:diguanylate cyclase (GGDEF)-like protein
MTLANMRLREKLRLESIHDSLTGLYNRRYMDKCLQTEISRSKRHNFNFGVLLFDIDHFKNLNDTYGHEAGDVVLRKLSDYLQQNVRSEDVLCRYGGEEFLIILPDISKNDLQKISERIQKEIKKNIQVEYENHKLCITVSVGAANFPDNGQAATELLKAADEALYRAKDQGRDQVCIASGLDI